MSRAIKVGIMPIFVRKELACGTRKKLLVFHGMARVVPFQNEIIQFKMKRRGRGLRTDRSGVIDGK